MLWFSPKTNTDLNANGRFMMIVFALDKVDLCLHGYTLLATTFPHGKVKERRCLIVTDKVTCLCDVKCTSASEGYFGSAMKPNKAKNVRNFYSTMLQCLNDPRDKPELSCMLGYTLRRIIRRWLKIVYRIHFVFFFLSSIWYII